MDRRLVQFRRAANRENRHRPVRQRYSQRLQQRAVEYWQERNNEEGLRTIAAALGVAPTTLQRWARASRRARFRSIEVRAPKASTEATSVAILITEAGSRVEGLSIESAARLLTLLR